MKTIRFGMGLSVLCVGLTALSALAQTTTPSVPTAPTTPIAGGAIKDTSITPGTSATIAQDNTATTHLDNAVAALTKGDRTTTTEELQTGIAGLEAEAQQRPTSFKDKLISHASKLKALLPLIPTGALGSGVLGKAVSLAKLASGGNQLEGILAAGSLLGKGSQLTNGLSGIGSALSALGGKSSGQSLISSALATVGKLDQGGVVAKAAEPAARTQLSSVLSFVKGAL